MPSRTELQARRAMERRRQEDRKRRGGHEPDDSPAWLDLDKAAALLGTSVRHVKFLTERGKLPFRVRRYRHGCFVRRVKQIPRIAAIEFLEEQIIRRLQTVRRHIRPR